MKKRASDGQLRYWIRRVRLAGFQVCTASREVDPHPYTAFSEIPVGPRYYVNQLIKQGYNVQLKIR